MIVATAGHVDHGKTLLVKTLSGVDTDRLAEEKTRGLTIDLGFAYIHQEGQASIGFVDVPGHTKFISNMLAGVSSIDHALLVIAADDGPMPQTHEHLTILRLLGIEQLTVVVTKIDRVNSEQKETTLGRCSQLIQQAGYPAVPIFPVSSMTGEGITELKAHLWQINKKLAKRQNASLFRLAIDRRFTIKGSGLVVTGSIFSGQVSIGDEVYLMPQAKKLRVRSLHRQNQEAETAQIGDRCAINLAGDIDLKSVQRGDWLSASKGLPYSLRIDVALSFLSSEAYILKHWTPVHVHAAAQHTTGRIALLTTKNLNPGEKTFAQIVLSEPISTCYGDRIIFRDQMASRTIAGGYVLDPYSVSRGRGKRSRLDQLEALSEPALEMRLEKFVLASKHGAPLAQLQQAFNLAELQFSYPTDTSGLSFHPDHLATYCQQLVQQLRNDGPTLVSKLRSSLGVSTGYFELIQTSLASNDLVVVDDNKLQLKGQKLKLSPAETTVWKKVEAILVANPKQPPVVFELAKQTNLPAKTLEKLLVNCIKQGLILKPIKNRYFLPATLTQFRDIAIRVAENSADNKFSVIQFRDAAEIGRNLAIELLEHLDGLGFTKRLGDQRIIQDKSR